jgi:hypothetical protein
MNYVLSVQGSSRKTVLLNTLRESIILSMQQLRLQLNCQLSKEN